MVMVSCSSGIFSVMLDLRCTAFCSMNRYLLHDGVVRWRD